MKIFFIIITVALAGWGLYFGFNARQESKAHQAAARFICSDVQEETAQFFAAALGGAGSRRALESVAVFKETMDNDRGLAASASYFRKLGKRSKTDQEQAAEKIADRVQKQCPASSNPISTSIAVGMMLGNFSR